MSEVKLVAMTVPQNIEGVKTAEEFIAYAARVSNPGNQINSETAPRLLKYLIKHKHFSPFEMVSLTLEIKTTRDIGRQILRHRSFSFQEFSQRYAEVTDQFVIREARMQDEKNRQNSIKTIDTHVHLAWEQMQEDVQRLCKSHYNNALRMGIAKEQARVVLPEGMTMSTMYMTGTLRSWIHYCELRMANGTQLEHQDIAKKCWEIILKKFPSLSVVLEKDEPPKENKPLSEIDVENIVKKFIEEKRYIPSQTPWTAPMTTYPPMKHDIYGHGTADPYFTPMCSMIKEGGTGG